MVYLGFNLGDNMIITLCGSARFESHFHLWNEILTISGHTVFSLAVYPSTKKGVKNWYSKEEKKILDKAHESKINASSAVVFLNVMAYMGPSTLHEVQYARRAGKKIYALESWGKGNGIGGNHYGYIQKKAQELGVFREGSPIDTFYPHFRDIYDLLPDAGGFRSGLVERVEKFEAEYYKEPIERKRK